MSTAFTATVEIVHSSSSSESSLFISMSSVCEDFPTHHLPHIYSTVNRTVIVIKNCIFSGSMTCRSNLPHLAVWEVLLHGLWVIVGIISNLPFKISYVIISGRLHLLAAFHYAIWRWAWWAWRLWFFFSVEGSFFSVGGFFFLKNWYIASAMFLAFICSYAHEKKEAFSSTKDITNYCFLSLNLIQLLLYCIAPE